MGEFITPSSASIKNLIIAGVVVGDVVVVVGDVVVVVGDVVVVVGDVVVVVGDVVVVVDGDSMNTTSSSE
jgi:hypothetical protein